MIAMSRQGRLWIVSDLYYPEDVATGHFLTGIAEGLAEDHDVEVLTAQPSYAQAGTRAPRSEVHAGVTIRRLRSTSFAKDRLVLRAINVATFTMALCLAAVLRFRRGDQVICVTNPPTVAPLLALIARLRGSRLHLLVHDVFPETLVAAGMLEQGTLATRILQSFAGIAYRQAASVVVLGRDMAALAASKRGSAAGIVIIENWADLDEILPLPRCNNRFLAAPEFAGRRVLQFSGNIGRTHAVETVLGAARQLSNAAAAPVPWHFLFAGFGGKLPLVEAEVAEGSLTNVSLLPRQDRTLLNELLNAADAAVIGFVPGMVGLSVPSRMYNLMAAGKPIIALAEPGHELSQVIAETGCGWRLDPGDSAGLAALLDSGLSDEMLRERGDNGRRAALTRFSRASKIAQWRQLLGLADHLPDFALGMVRSER